MHRAIMKPIKNLEVDHINGERNDNRKKNLRLVSRKQNRMNTRVSKSNTSGYKGVTYDKRKKKWMAQIHINKKNIFIGYFSNKKDAAVAYNEKAKQLFKQYAKLNSII